MDDSANLSTTGDDDSSLKVANDAKSDPISAPARHKEEEPQAVSGDSSEQTEKAMLSEIVKSSDAADDQAEARIKEAMDAYKKGSLEVPGEAIARLAVPDPKISEDLTKVGLKSPQQEANLVIQNGTTLNVEMSEEELKDDLKSKVSGSVSRPQKVVYGVSSVVALAFWVARRIKVAHKKMMKVIFRGKAAVG